MKMGPIKILTARAYSGANNMALDEALLEACQDGHSPVLRLYDWSPPTLSLGRFQYLKSEEEAWVTRFCGDHGFDLVRRSTGGGAILHHQEITYSVVCPLAHPFLTEGREQLYRRFHRAWIATLAKLFPDAQSLVLLEDSHAGEAINPKALLCFARRTAFDVVAKGRPSLVPEGFESAIGDQAFGAFRKVIGSAQRRSKNALLQHGSVKIGQSLEGDWTLPVASREEFDFSRLAQELAPVLVGELGFEKAVVEAPSAELLEQADEIAKAKYANPKWTNSAKL